MCVPARQSLITGRYPHAHGALTNAQFLGPEEVTLGHVAADAGIATGAIGKVHVAGPERHYGFAAR
ncbi:MAG: sulfatase-like hydrolase/transferase [Chloroflexota bacterium]|nr:sulfatase-like hydrolase/transferase [Chloroflexota bacterium]